MATARDNLARKQIYIPATQPEEEIVLRVAAYCRVSTDSEDQINSFAAQNDHYTEMITAHDQRSPYLMQHWGNPWTGIHGVKKHSRKRRKQPGTGFPAVRGLLRWHWGSRVSWQGSSLDS